MEQRGAVNAYAPYAWRGESIYTVNLAAGVTPFMLLVAGREYHSLMYRLGGHNRIVIKEAWYRPTREEFDRLESCVQHHVLNGGLLHAPLAEVCPLIPDPVEDTWECQRFGAWCLLTYGRRLEPIG